ncbi:hypothetical protein GOP47_0015818 [Adiantum capillus-veneris]|uniref:Uncharacterized protein n=1 Tax=Adiantum capillus-veneris TaxID=13818 RepID=A0A9D4ZCZ1_ADICA|nr:hypothetical protein GOP47_0015818 [Adiantum capillus-veneris]
MEHQASKGSEDIEASKDATKSAQGTQSNVGTTQTTTGATSSPNVGIRDKKGKGLIKPPSTSSDPKWINAVEV